MQSVDFVQTDISVSDNLLVKMIGIYCARTVSEDCCTRLCDWSCYSRSILYFW